MIDVTMRNGTFLLTESVRARFRSIILRGKLGFSEIDAAQRNSIYENVFSVPRVRRELVSFFFRYKPIPPQGAVGCR